MKAILLLLCACFLGGQAIAQSSIVRPGELSLSVEAAEGEATLLAREMILITIRGLYRRHITRETLQQPAFDGFSWTQLGADSWTEERIAGKKVKIFQRRMAIYPDRPGRLTIGPFKHQLTLTDEGDDWFEHDVTSAPLVIDVAPAPPIEGWWFPVRSVRVSDSWSNAPALLKPGEGVLRTVRLEALGATPEMMPPMPALKSPSAMIFAHPEKRLVELSPAGPVTYAFWRWTIRPANKRSAVVEPISFSYYDTIERAHKTVTIAAQRVAYGELTPEPRGLDDPPRPSAHLPGWSAGIASTLVFLGGILSALWGCRLTWTHVLHMVPWMDPLALRLRYSAWRGDIVDVRRAAAAMITRDGSTSHSDRCRLLDQLDSQIFGHPNDHLNLKLFAKTFLQWKAVKHRVYA